MEKNIESIQDVFISHAGPDKEPYINPLIEALDSIQITYWLDNSEITWGDSIVTKINEGLRKSRFFLLCLSQSYLQRPWPESELNAALAIQNNDGKKKVLPLILNKKDEILAYYPILAGLAYREFSSGTSIIANEISTICGRSSKEGEIHLTVESVHTGKLFSISANPRVSVKWLTDRAVSGMGVTDRADTGGYLPFRIRWVLVDSRAWRTWKNLNRNQQQLCKAIIATESGDVISTSDYDRLTDLGIRDGTVFNMCAIEDIDYPPEFNIMLK